ncbi:MAG: hypothetical protein MJK12_07325 [Colwellia sp.]|nr:hypothetical protein [Colwellia sp.]
MKLIILIIFILLNLHSLNALASEDIALSLAIEKNTQKIEEFFNLTKNSLVSDEVISVSSEVIKQRKLYSKNTIAKVFILLANVASNKNDVDRAFQFANDGLMLSINDLSLKLNLLLKVASGYYAKGQYHKVLEISNDAILIAKSTVNTKYMLLTLAYRSMAYALLAEYEKAFEGLQKVESIIEKNQAFSENIELLEIIATAHYYLGDFKTALTINQKILKLRYDLSLKSDLAVTYYNLARSYHRLGMLDDAYNAYWETKKYAQEKESDVQLAYAELGLGEVLLLQNDFKASYIALLKAEKIFKIQSLDKPYLNVVIALAKSSYANEKIESAHQFLQQAEKVMVSMVLINEQMELYLLLSAMYESKGKYEKALYLLNQYIVANQQFSENKLSNILLRNNSLPEQDKSRQLVIKLAEKSELSATYSKKFKKQAYIIFILSILVIVLIVFIIVYAIKERSRRINIAYDEREKPLYFLESPIATKQIYQRAYKKARKYDYPISIGYISIDNWKELTFRFNKKILTEVSKTIATLINEHIGEFDSVGLINEGEYLLLYPHQSSQDVEKEFEQLKDALNVRFFANLGDFSVNIHFTLDTPSVQDIDPYIFLSRLSETAAPAGSGIEYSSKKNSGL